MAINYADKYQKELDQKIEQGTVTSDLVTEHVNWLDAKTFKIQSVSVSGYKNHNRSGGFNKGTVDNEAIPYTLSFDRDIEFFVDKADVDETNQALSAGNITKEFMLRHAIPEMDAYRFSKLATSAKNSNQIITGSIDTENVFTTLKSAILKVRKYGTQNLLLYVSSEVMDALERSKDFTRKIDINSNNGTIETRVTTLDGVKLIEVWDENRFYTEYKYDDGFKPADTASKINFIIVYKGAVIAKTKISSIYLFEPGTHTEGDGYLYQNRIYHDLFVLDKQKDGVWASIQGTPSGENPPSGEGTRSAGVLEDMNKSELLAEAKAKGIQNYSNMTKDDLIEALEDYQADNINSEQKE